MFTSLTKCQQRQKYDSSSDTWIQRRSIARFAACVLHCVPWEVQFELTVPLAGWWMFVTSSLSWFPVVCSTAANNQCSLQDCLRPCWVAFEPAEGVRRHAPHEEKFIFNYQCITLVHLGTKPRNNTELRLCCFVVWLYNDCSFPVNMSS